MFFKVAVAIGLVSLLGGCAGQRLAWQPVTQDAISTGVTSGLQKCQYQADLATPGSVNDIDSGAAVAIAAGFEEGSRKNRLIGECMRVSGYALEPFQAGYAAPHYRLAKDSSGNWSMTPVASDGSEASN